MTQIRAYGQAIIKTHLKIHKVIDGDGLIVVNMFGKQEEEIRLLGIDAPEIKRCRKLLQDERETHLPGQLLMELGSKSKKFLSELVPVGSHVTLQMERVNGYDVYGRTLAYAFLQEGTCINEVMIKEGYAKPYNRYGCLALADYQQLNIRARAEGKGLYQMVANF